MVPGRPAIAPPKTPATGFSGKLNRSLNNGKANYNAIYVTAEKPFTDQATWGFTTALTLQRARSNVAQELNSDEFYNGHVPRRLRLEPRQWRSEMELGDFGQLPGAVRHRPFGHSDAQFRAGVRPYQSRRGTRPSSFLIAGRGFRHLRGNLGGVFFPGRCRVSHTSGSTCAWRRPSRLPWGHELTADFEVFNAFNCSTATIRHGMPVVATIRRALRPAGRDDARAVPGRTALQVLS